jgi:DNA-binding CsgD family transcriptional regulator
LILPHVRQMMALQTRLGLLDARVESFELALDLLASPVFLIDRSCRLYFANRAGDEALRHAAPLQLRQGRLCGSQPELTASLLVEAARAVSATDGSLGVARAHEVPVGGEDRARGTLLFYPLRGVATSDFAPRAEIIVILTRADDHRPSSAMLLRAAFGLSAGEAGLALSLAAGERLHDVAARNEVSMETVRTQLKAIFVKTGTRRQSDLIRLIQAQSSVALRGPA